MKILFNSLVIALLTVRSLAAEGEPPSPPQNKFTYLEDNVLFFERNAVIGFNGTKWKWEVTGDYFLFWNFDFVLYVTDWRRAEHVDILEEGPNYVIFIDKTYWGRTVIRRVNFLTSWNSVTFVDKETENRKFYKISKRRQLKSAE